MFCRVARFYSLGYAEIMAMPAATFWEMNNNIVRISAEQDMRQLTLVACANSEKGVEHYRKRLELEVGQPVKTDPRNAQRDEEGVGVLKMLAGA